MIKIHYLPAFCTLALLLAGTSCRRAAHGQGDNAGLVSDATEALLATEPARLEPVGDEITLNATVSCDESRLGKVYVPCSGKVGGIKVQIGDHVERGQLLGVVHSTDAAEYQKQLSVATAALGVAERQYRMKADMHSSGMASDKEVEEALADLEAAKAERRRLAQVEGINGFAGKADATLRSPISGYIITKNIYNDSYIDDTNNDDPAFEIADISSVWVIGNVYESDIAKVSQGQKVYVTTASYPGKSYPGTIDRIYSVLDSESRTMKVRVCLSNPGALLKPGLFATIHVVLPSCSGALPSVPAAAVVFENGKQYVVVHTGRKQYRLQEIAVAKATATRTYIQSGVEPGQQVVSRNALLIYNALTNE